MIELLLQRDEVDVNAKDINGRSPTCLGQREGDTTRWSSYCYCGKMLTHTPGINYRITPLSWATEEDRETVIELLLEGEVLPRIWDISAEMLLVFSCFSCASCDTMTPT
jgi:hypothetical protein